MREFSFGASAPARASRASGKVTPAARRLAAGLGLGVILGGCSLPKVSPEHHLPPLVVVTGTAEIPDDYLVMAGSVPAPRGFRVSLSRLDGTILASGTIVSSSGEFSVSVPKTQLTAGSALYEVTLRNGLGAAVYSAPAKGHSQGSFGRVRIDATSTALFLAAKTAHEQGRPVAHWDFAGLAEDERIRRFAQRIAMDAAERSNEAPGQSLLSLSPLPSEFQSGVQQVIAIAEAHAR